jgi:competence protein ComEA
VSLSAQDADHDGDPVLGALDRLGELADRIGVSIPTLVGGTLATVAAAVAVYLAFVAPQPPPAELTIPYANPAVPVAASTVTSDAAVPPEVTVHAAGAVRHPGVYVLPETARVADLLSAAGGPLPEADLDRVNLAAPVADGARVYVPAVGQEAPPPVVAGDGGPGTARGPSAVDPGRLVDLNRAGAAELESLPGVGPATAAAIIDHRERNGPFTRVDDLLAVRGIGEAKLASLRDRVHV